MNIVELDAMRCQAYKEFQETHRELFKTDFYQYFVEQRKYADERVRELIKERNAKHP